MSHHPRTVADESAWTSDQLMKNDDWIIRLDDGQGREIEAALQSWRGIGGLAHQASPQTFPLPGWQKVIADAKRSLLGKGVALIKGFPVEGHSDRDCSDMYWGLGAHLGVAVTQTNTGELMVPVYDRKFRGESTERSFGYASDKELEFHVDPTDVLGLLCIRKAKYGGESRLVSAAAIHNEMLKSRPELVAALYDGFAWMRRYPGAGRFSAPIPVFSTVGGRLGSRFHRRYIDTGAELAGVELSPLQVEALDYFATLSERPDFAAEFVLQPGDVMLVNNYLVLHAKKNQKDEGDPMKGRMLLRLWIYMEGLANYEQAIRDEPGRYGIVGLTAAEWWGRQEAAKLLSSVGLPLDPNGTRFSEDWAELHYAPATKEAAAVARA